MMYGPDSYDIPNHGLDVDRYRELRKELMQDVRDATYLAKSCELKGNYTDAKFYWDLVAERSDQLRLL